MLRFAALATMLGLLAGGTAHAAATSSLTYYGNVTATGTGACDFGTDVKFAIQITTGTYTVSSGTQTDYFINILATGSGIPNPQYITVTIKQVGSATSGIAFVYDPDLVGNIEGTWTGTITVSDGFLTSPNLEVTNGSGASACNLWFNLNGVQEPYPSP
jgi:hypothetical protein